MSLKKNHETSLDLEDSHIHLHYQPTFDSICKLDYDLGETFNVYIWQ